MSTKPILFKTDMVRAILEDRKTATRRVAKGYALEHLELDTDGSIIGVYNQFEGRVFPVMEYAPCQPGDILYVRETWNRDPFRYDRFIYRADDCYGPSMPWRPSIHMPREAARIFLRVRDVRVERLQDITGDEALEEGCGIWGNVDWAIFPRDHFMDVWSSTIRPADRALYGWDANPWVWVIEFERCEKPEAAS